MKPHNPALNRTCAKSRAGPVSSTLGVCAKGEYKHEVVY
jgi:hypothetical protein